MPFYAKENDHQVIYRPHFDRSDAFITLELLSA
jgi:hypothetical protein